MNAEPILSILKSPIVTASIFIQSLKVGRCHLHKPNLEGLFLSGHVLHVYDEAFSDQHPICYKKEVGDQIFYAHMIGFYSH
jgi:hypothetical protein